MSRRWAEWRSQWRRGWRRLVQSARLACGVPDYDAYIAHMRETHPDAPVMDYAAFFRERMQARYGRGRSRCC